MSLFQHICVCNSGYHGDGKSCVLTDMCKVHNGKCHPKVNFVNSKSTSKIYRRGIFKKRDHIIFDAVIFAGS